ncbi:MAG: PA2779 family protein [Deltaproteobacteria bacterium]
MRKIKTIFVFKTVALYLAVVFLLIGSVPRNSWAYFVESQQALSFSREADINKIQRALESKMVSQRLSELGLSMNEINSKLNQLSDADVHQFASQMDSLMPGGDAGVAIILLLVITILVLVIIQMTGHKIVIK